MRDIRKISEEYAEIGDRLIKTEDQFENIRDSHATIIYLSSEHKKTSNGKLVFAQCEKVQDKNKWAIPADFTITVFEPNVEKLNPRQIKIVLFHELMHVGIDCPGGNETYRIIPHDLEDFRAVIERFGVDWSDAK